MKRARCTKAGTQSRLVGLPATRPSFRKRTSTSTTSILQVSMPLSRVEARSSASPSECSCPPGTPRSPTATPLRPIWRRPCGKRTLLWCPWDGLGLFAAKTSSRTCRWPDLSSANGRGNCGPGDETRRRPWSSALMDTLWARRRLRRAGAAPGGRRTSEPWQRELAGRHRCGSIRRRFQHPLVQRAASVASQPHA